MATREKLEKLKKIVALMDKYDGSVAKVAGEIECNKTTIYRYISEAVENGIVPDDRWAKDRHKKKMMRLQEAVDAYHASNDNVVNGAKSLGIPRTTMQDRLDTARAKGLLPSSESNKKQRIKDLKQAVDAYKECGTVAEAARMLGISRGSLYSRIESARRNGIYKEIPDDNSNNDLNADSDDADIKDKHIESLESTITILRDQIRDFKSKIRKSHREKGIYAALCDEMHSVIKPLEPLPKTPLKLQGSEHIESLVMHLSDEHADAVVKPHRVGGLEDYNFDVALARAEHYVQKVISISRSTLSNYKFNELWVLAYGDHISGEIHDHSKYASFRNVMDATIATGQMHALMIRDLAAYFPIIRVVYLPGNHGRRSKKKNYKGPTENWDYMIGQVSQMLCIDIPNVDFLIPDSYSVVLEINGWNFCVFHGDDIRSWNNIPHYGIERKTRRLSALHAASGKQIHYFIMGHFHNRSSTEHPNGETLLNGAWPATDEYAYEKLGLATRPSQLLHGVGSTYGVSFRFPIYLKFDGDIEGPKRYSAPCHTMKDYREVFKS